MAPPMALPESVNRCAHGCGAWIRSHPGVLSGFGIETICSACRRVLFKKGGRNGR